MKYITNDLIGWRLDQAVAKAMGYGHDVAKSSMIATTVSTGVTATEEGCTIICDGQPMHYSPSSKWEHGGPIIASEYIELYVGVESGERFWMSACHCRQDTPTFIDLIGGQAVPKGHRTLAEIPKTGHGDGPTPLVAAMRAFVAHKLGEAVDL